MARVPAYLLTAILAICFIIQLSSKAGSGVPRGGAFASLLAIGILWAVVLLEGMPARAQSARPSGVFPDHDSGLRIAVVPNGPMPGTAGQAGDSGARHHA